MGVIVRAVQNCMSFSLPEAVVVLCLLAFFLSTVSLYTWSGDEFVKAQWGISM